MTMIKFNETVNDTYESILTDLLDELESIEKDDSERIDFHERIHEIVDNAVSSNSRQENLELIDDTGGEDTIDSGLVDHNADITMQIAQTAYACLEQELFNDDLMQKLQTALNNNFVDYDESQELIAEIKERLE